MKPRCEYAPEWAMWLACSWGGMWRWFENDPKAQSTSCFWFTGTGRIEEAIGFTENEPYLGWKRSKEKRPEKPSGVTKKEGKK